MERSAQKEFGRIAVTVEPTKAISMVNAMSLAEFVNLLGGVFEHSPWITERAYGARPFADVAQLHQVMVDIVRHVTREEQLGLLRAHPELGGEDIQAGKLTESSRAEQLSVGLNTLSPEEYARIKQLNLSYRAKFGFPFIIAVRHYNKLQIVVRKNSRSCIMNNMPRCLGAVMA